MSNIIELGAEAMRVKRRELINQPLDRIWPELMKAAMHAISEPVADLGDSKREPTSAFKVMADHFIAMGKQHSQP